MKVQNKTRFKLISTCSKPTSTKVINIFKRFDKQKLINAAVLLGNAALSLDWVECRRKICLFERVPRRLFIHSSSSHVRLLLGAAMLIKCSKKLYFSKERRGAFLLFDAKAIRGDALSIKCDRILCF